MTIKQELDALLTRDVEGLIASPDSLKLLKLASLLLLNGNQPRTCSNSQRKYYQQLKQLDMNAIERAEAVKSRTCKPAWNGLRYINGDHYDNTNITDAEAVKLLTNGLLNKSDFVKLPDGYEVKSTETPVTTHPIKQAQPNRPKRKR
jgi:hypothetical protein